MCVWIIWKLHKITWSVCMSCIKLVPQKADIGWFGPEKWPVFPILLRQYHRQSENTPTLLHGFVRHDVLLGVVEVCTRPTQPHHVELPLDACEDGWQRQPCRLWVDFVYLPWRSMQMGKVAWQHQACQTGNQAAWATLKGPVAISIFLPYKVAGRGWQAVVDRGLGFHGFHAKPSKSITKHKS